MLPIKKFTIGIRPAKKMFRVQSSWGLIADKVFAHVRKSKDFASDYFSGVQTSDARDGVNIVGEEAGNSLVVNMSDVVFTKDFYDHERPVDPKAATREFAELWKVVDSILNITSIRRIGIVGAAMFEDVDSPSLSLLNSITKLEGAHHPAKFALRYEERQPTLAGLAPDLEKDDFHNIIYTFHDSTMDAEHATENAMSVSLDYQRYYAPPLQKDISKSVEKMLPTFDGKWSRFSDRLVSLGVGDQ